MTYKQGDRVYVRENLARLPKRLVRRRERQHKHVVELDGGFRMFCTRTISSSPLPAPAPAAPAIERKQRHENSPQSTFGQSVGRQQKPEQVSKARDEIEKTWFKMRLGFVGVRSRGWIE